MSTRTIDDVRSALFAALDGLTSNKMDIDRAKAISDVAQTIINSAKVEVDFIRATGGESSRFLGSQGAQQEPLPPGIVGIRQHRIAG